VTNVFVAVDGIIKLSDLAPGRYFTSARSSCWQQVAKQLSRTGKVAVGRQIAQLDDAVNRDEHIRHASFFWFCRLNYLNASSKISRQS
jgi:predicted DNA-binding ribbon-helix-helix protein